MHNLDLILTITGGLSAALLLGYLTQRLGLSSIVGYLLAGLLVGPHTPGFVADATLAEQLAEIGVILLMFGVGLQFHVEELLAVRRIAVPGALLQSGAATVLGAVLAVAFGWTWNAAVVFGLALSVASTVVLVRVLSDNNALHTSSGHIAVGWLVVEDLLTVLALVLLPAVFGSRENGLPLWITLLITAAKVGALVAFAAIVGTRVIPRVLDHVSATRSRELFTLTVLVVALGIAVGSALVFGVSMALGAFVAGMVVGRSEYSLRAATDALPMRDAFAVLFFVSVGMLLEPTALLESPGFVLATLAVVMVVKPLVALLISRLMGYPFATSLAVAIALAQIGEFSFILSKVGQQLGLLPGGATNAIVSAAIVSIVANPLLYRSVGPVERWVSRHTWLRRLLNPPVRPATARSERPRSTWHRAVVVGCGPTGQTVVRLLRENGIQPTVVELNMATVRALRDSGVDAVYGDATHVDTLRAAGVERSAHLLMTSSAMRHAQETIRRARELNPDVRILARAEYLRDHRPLEAVGADTVFSAEGEVALAFVEATMQRLGATAEQIDRERDRAHRDLFGQPDSNRERPDGVS